MIKLKPFTRKQYQNDKVNHKIRCTQVNNKMTNTKNETKKKEIKLQIPNSFTQITADTMKPTLLARTPPVNPQALGIYTR